MARWCNGTVNIGILLAALAWGLPAEARDVVDQQQTTIDYIAQAIALGGPTHQRLTQIVTAGVSEPMVALDLPLSCNWFSANITIDIRTVENGLPGATLLSHTTGARPRSNNSFGYSFDLQDPVPLTAGQQYAIVLSSDSDCTLLSGPDGDSYAGGDSYANDDRIPLFPQVWTAMMPRRDLPFKTRVGRRADVQMTFGPYPGLWRLTPDQQWIQVHSVTPAAIVTGNFDADPTDDVVVDFASAGGLWVLYNRSVWRQLHPVSPAKMVAGDFDNDGRDELAVAFSGYGLFIWDAGVWTQIRDEVPRMMVAGDIDSGAEELVADFDSDGLGFWDGSHWTSIAPVHPSSLVIATLTDFGGNEIVAGFPGLGLWRWSRSSGWQRLHAVTPKLLAVADLNRSTARQVVVDFGAAYGIWILRDGTRWTWLHPLTSEGISVADRDGSGRDDLLINFGATWGLWQYTNDLDWIRVHPHKPTLVSARRFR